MSARWITAAWGLLVVAFVVVVSSLGAGQLSPDLLFQSDALYLPALFRDVVQEGGRWVDWRLPPAPYWFPDLLLYFAWNAVLGDFRLAIVAQAATQVALLALGGQLVARAIDREAVAPQVAAVAGAAVLLALYAGGRFDTGIYLLVTAHHFGVVLGSLFALAGVLTWARRGASRGVVAAVVLVCAATAASDAMFGLYFTLPAAIALLVDRRARIAAAVAAASVVGWGLPPLLYLRFRKHGLPWHLQLDEVGSTLAALGRDVLTVSPVALLWCVALAGAVLHLRKRAAVASGYVGLLVLACPAAMALTGLYDGPTELRYLLAPLFVPLMVGCAAVRARAAAIAMVGAAALLLVVAARRPGARLLRYTSPLVACLDAQGLHGGVSDYWNAKHVTMLSRSGLRVQQVEPSGRPYHWLNNRTWYVQTPARYDFVLPARLDAALLAGEFGAPSRRITCAGEEVWVYGDELDSRARDTFSRWR